MIINSTLNDFTHFIWGGVLSVEEEEFPKIFNQLFRLHSTLNYKHKQTYECCLLQVVFAWVHGKLYNCFTCLLLAECEITSMPDGRRNDYHHHAALCTNITDEHSFYSRPVSVVKRSSELARVSIPDIYEYSTLSSSSASKSSASATVYIQHNSDSNSYERRPVFQRQTGCPFIRGRDWSRNRGMGASSNSAIRPSICLSVCLSVCPMRLLAQ